MTLSLHCAALALTFSTAALGFGCSSSSSNGNDPSTPTFTQVYENVMVPNGCTSHHAPGGESFLEMNTQSNAYENLVNVKSDGPACGKSGLTRVVPGDASNSLMYLKVSESKPPCGGQMPLGGTPLSASDQAEIAAWINAGAKND